MGKRIPFTPRKKWHRSSDRWEWDGYYRRRASPKRPFWQNGADMWYWFSAPMTRGPVIELGTLTERRASLRRIPAPRKAPR